MDESIRIVDNFCPKIEEVKASFRESGFASWLPNKGEVGSSVYENMSFWGLHALLLKPLTLTMGCAVLPNNMFARVTNVDTEKGYVHSDRASGAKTCLVYLTDHKEVSGTGFYKHRRTGLVEMPTVEDMKTAGILEEMKHDMVEGGDAEWEQIDFVRGVYNRAVIFHSPLFHSRFPKNGIGENLDDGRMIWGCHFHTLKTLE